MQIFSEDSFFILGLNSLLIKLNISAPENLIFFDTGQDYIYVFDDDEAKQFLYFDPISMFIFCRRTLMDRSAGLNIFSRQFSGWRFKRKKRRTPTSLTASELLIIKKIFLGMSHKYIATQLHISEKTVSAHKLNALRKLRIKNIAIFLTEYFAWYDLWTQYMMTREKNSMNIPQCCMPGNGDI
ncbi:LuxR family transcriptional regulator [Enterobacter cloacae subsp. cloacae]|uniref:response regulator transcription factor n=1 Tax=Enterobacter cloacae TaxID=550 RepID=UPI00063AD210|nr:LuxR C-terminal-related transcriptional regulator [Enterobacter cloacae]KLG05277.1 LuxR family transcriptional regulator [Enterobacter cloacae subsp. cloacae]